MDQKYITMSNTPCIQRFILLSFTLASRPSGVMFYKWEKVFDFLSGINPDLCRSNSAAISNGLSHLTHPVLVFPVAVTRNSALISFTSILLTWPFLCN